ncbi:fasciclin domain-containing protein [Eudoraea sp.]
MDQSGNYSKVTKTDVMASNGVIHIIEDVVMP